MAWTSLASNQTVSYNNLQNAVNNGYFSALTTIPTGTEQITKTDASTYVNVNTGYSTFAAKASNQLVTRTDMRPLFNSATFYYSGDGGGFWTGWADGATACASYGANSSTLYWNGSFTTGATIFTSYLISSSNYFIVNIGGTIYKFAADSTGFYDSILGLYAHGMYYLEACPPPAYTWTDAKYGTDFFNLCFELSQTVYTSTPTIGVGTTIYIDSGLTTVLGSADYISIPAASSGLIWNISMFSGVITGDTGSNC